MTALADRVETKTETELGRLGSEKLLLAATGADIRDATVSGSLASTFAVGTERLETWASETDDEAVAAALHQAAETLAECHEEMLDAWAGAEGLVDPVVDPEDPGDGPGRVGAGLVGLPLVLDRLLLQGVSYHVNEANTAEADRLRKCRNSVGAIPESAAAVLDEGDEAGAIDAAVVVVQAAYERYADRLEGMGLDPKPLC